MSKSLKWKVLQQCSQLHSDACCILAEDVVEKYRNSLDVDDQEEIIPDLWRSFGGDDDG